MKCLFVLAVLLNVPLGRAVTQTDMMVRAARHMQPADDVDPYASTASSYRFYRMLNMGFTGWRPCVFDVSFSNTSFEDGGVSLTDNIAEEKIHSSGYYGQGQTWGLPWKGPQLAFWHLSGKNPSLAGQRGHCWRPNCHPCDDSQAWLGVDFGTPMVVKEARAKGLGVAENGGKDQRWRGGVKLQGSNDDGNADWNEKSWVTLGENWDSNHVKLGDAHRSPAPTAAPTSAPTSAPTAAPTSDPTPHPTPPPTPYPTPDPTLPPLDSSPGDYGQLTRCQGDCDSDDDCLGGLECYSPDGDKPETFPSCLGSAQHWDYCVDRSTDYRRHTGVARCPEGLAISENECRKNGIDAVDWGSAGNWAGETCDCFRGGNGIRYFNRDTAGCTVRAGQVAYCKGPDQNVQLDSSRGADGKLKRCQGDCDKNSDCATGICYLVPDGIPHTIPGCSGISNGWDYCGE